MVKTKANFENLFASVFAIPFLLIMIFGFTMSFFNSPNISGAAVLALIDGLYLAKKLLLFICFAFCFFRKYIPWGSLLAVAIALVSVLVTYLISATQFELFMDIYLDFFCGLVCFLLLFGGVVKLDRLMPIAAAVARVLLVLCIVTLLTLPNLNSFISRNYMTVSNAFLMPIGILFYSIYRKGHWWDYLLILAGLLIVLIYGSRGGFLMLSFLAVTILYIKMQKKKVLFLLFIVLFVLVGAVLIVQSDILSQSTSRTLQKILNGELFDSSGRFEIWEYLLSRSLSNGFIGRGLCADRMYLIELYNTNEQVYAHNFLVELLTDFGLLGFIAGIALIVVLIGFLRRCGEPLEKIAVVIFVFTSFLQLMFSRTFLSEPGFFIMMGIVLRWRVFFKNKKGEHRYEKGVGYHPYLQEQ